VLARTVVVLHGLDAVEIYQVSLFREFETYVMMKV